MSTPISENKRREYADCDAAVESIRFAMDVEADRDEEFAYMKSRFAAYWHRAFEVDTRFFHMGLPN